MFVYYAFFSKKENNNNPQHRTDLKAFNFIFKQKMYNHSLFKKTMKVLDRNAYFTNELKKEKKKKKKTPQEHGFNEQPLKATQFPRRTPANEKRGRGSGILL